MRRLFRFVCRRFQRNISISLWINFLFPFCSGFGCNIKKNTYRRHSVDQPFFWVRAGYSRSDCVQCSAMTVLLLPFDELSSMLASAFGGATVPLPSFSWLKHDDSKCLFRYDFSANVLWHRWHSKFLSAECVCMCARKFERSANAVLMIWIRRERGETKRKSKKFKQRNALVKMDTHFIKRNNEHNSKTNTNKKAHHIDNSIECKFSDGQSDECLNRKFENRKKNNETNGIIGCNVAITFPAVCTSVRFFARM